MGKQGDEGELEVEALAQRLVHPPQRLVLYAQYPMPNALAFSDETSEIDDYVRDDINAIALLLSRVLD